MKNYILKKKIIKMETIISTIIFSLFSNFLILEKFNNLTINTNKNFEIGISLNNIKH